MLFTHKIGCAADIALAKELKALIGKKRILVSSELQAVATEPGTSDAQCNRL